MIIPITLGEPRDKDTGSFPPALAQIGSSELVLIELQGDIEVEGNRRGQTVGKLTVDEDGKGKPTLRIGYHLLEGKVVSLPKPLAVLHRTSALPSHNLETEETSPTPFQPPSYTINAIVRKKLVFSKRPMPVVGSTSSFSQGNGKPASTVGGRVGGK
ncbi:Ctf8-domain-containing protein [Amylostereum chailletii]|nr:Ctf8-domain-containing protein [Amylostereum chailletii]